MSLECVKVTIFCHRARKRQDNTEFAIIFYSSSCQTAFIAECLSLSSPLGKDSDHAKILIKLADH
jgi:hypothetical protein